MGNTGISARSLLLLVAALVIISLAVGCAGAPAATPVPPTQPAAPKAAASPIATAQASPTVPPKAERSYKIGVTMIVEHPVLTAMFNGFKDELKAKGYVEGKNVEYEVKNAQGDITNATAIAKQFVNSKKDLIFAVGTPSIQAAARETKDIPIIYAGMTDPVAAGVAKTMEKPGGNLTGNSDWVDPEDDLKLLKQALPEFKSIGTIFNASEANSKSWVDRLDAVAKAQGLKVVSVPVANTGELQMAAQSLAGQVDLIFIGPDNTVASGMEVVAKAANSAKKMTASINETDVDRGILIGLGVDYYKLGQMAGAQADQVLKGKNPGDMPVEKLTQLSISVNTKTQEALGVKIPASVMANAKKVSK